jgi:hypothetical protein
VVPSFSHLPLLFNPPFFNSFLSLHRALERFLAKTMAFYHAFFSPNSLLALMRVKYDEQEQLGVIARRKLDQCTELRDLASPTLSGEGAPRTNSPNDINVGTWNLQKGCVTVRVDIDGPLHFINGTDTNAANVEIYKKYFKSKKANTRSNNSAANQRVMLCVRVRREKEVQQFEELLAYYGTDFF